MIFFWLTGTFDPKIGLAISHHEFNNKCYLCRMKNEPEIPIQKEEDMVAANLRRDNYSRTRDLQAQEFNSAIASRLLIKEKGQIKCDKCGKEFSSTEEITRCADCR